ncbi:MAG TPA: hypothetical protein VFM32_07585, partial [Spongiibacteraceae bacterium]|nr:hypothetical protein [Spongiibacteraceae bacterium]
LILTLILATVGTSALAEPPNRREQRNDDRRAVRDVIGEIEHNYRGHVIDVQPPATDEDTYRVRVLQEGGRVKTLHVPAKRTPDRNREK